MTSEKRQREKLTKVWPSTEICELSIKTRRTVYDKRLSLSGVLLKSASTQHYRHSWTRNRGKFLCILSWLFDNLNQVVSLTLLAKLFWLTRERLCVNRIRCLWSMHCVLLGTSFSRALGTVGSVITIGLSINRCSHSKTSLTRENKTQFKQSRLFSSSIKIRQNEALLARRVVVTCRHRLKKPQVMTG